VHVCIASQNRDIELVPKVRTPENKRVSMLPIYFLLCFDLSCFALFFPYYSSHVPIVYLLEAFVAIISLSFYSPTPSSRNIRFFNWYQSPLSLI
jgi:hypothetical protein